MIDSKIGHRIKDTFVIREKIPQQLDPVILKEFTDKVQTVTNNLVTLLSSNSVVGILLGVSLKAIWGMVYTL